MTGHHCVSSHVRAVCKLQCGPWACLIVAYPLHSPFRHLEAAAAAVAATGSDGASPSPQPPLQPPSASGPLLLLPLTERGYAELAEAVAAAPAAGQAAGWCVRLLSPHA